MPRFFSLSMGAALAAVAVILSRAGLTEAPKAGGDQAPPQKLSLFAGSKSCIECHAKFYQLWSTSLIRLTMTAPDNGVSAALLKASQDLSPPGAGRRGGRLVGAAATLKDLLAKHPGFTDGQLLLAEIYLQQ